MLNAWHIVDLPFSADLVSFLNPSQSFSADLVAFQYYSEILLSLKKEEDREKIKSLEVGVSGRHYALVPEGLWLGSLKRRVSGAAFLMALYFE
ncbi:hypothetical protein TSUD_352260 [Trifolium subterraneum]|nr:hypothetical protein TSUD_352260 [Trifolium subterraneum]